MQNVIVLDGAKKIMLHEVDSEIRFEALTQMDSKVAEQEFLSAAKNWLSYCGIDLPEIDLTRNELEKL